MQSYDFIELSRRYGVTLQVGGSDQWGNIVSGVELGRKLQDVKALYGLTTPLMVTSEGTKMGKSTAGAVWLDKELVSEFEYWQYWRNTADSDVIRFLKLFTEVPMKEIVEIEANFQGKDINKAKILLADEATRLLHGPSCLESIHNTVQSLFSISNRGSKNTASLLQGLESLQKTIISVSASFTPKDRSKGNLPWMDGVSSASDIVIAEMEDIGIFVVDLLVLAKLAGSKNSARRLIAAGGVRINDIPVISESTYLTENSFVRGQLKLSAGKKVHVLVVLEQ